ncbi:MAG: hypothetical protein KKD64_11115 [Alphaproteobacteria bacterium]|nr:hypothetical protein [Alphaproteobacteria bacterium]MBU0793072.1 hypothetical protein [Alphaproteobacteria bacterium]MBU0877680.1 hypothetical protein [Alphaproteobacteria bacterium]MBU1770192.1 hypothetical protein [Alphaproteobacteria bacterium]
MTAVGAAEQANIDCSCVTLNIDDLGYRLDSAVGRAGFGASLMKTHPHLFAASPVFMAAPTLADMKRVVDAVEAVVRIPGYQEVVLGWAPPIAMKDFGPAGALMGYDFHWTESGPILIEVNTNAGGAFLNAVLADAQRACCVGPSPSAGDVQSRFTTAAATMFRREWRRQRTAGTLRTIAIIDEDPQAQHLLPEFLLAQAQLEQQGFDVVVADPGELIADAGRLWVSGKEIDLVYNRLVDFALEQPANTALRKAYLHGEVVVTPNPHVHALFADKRNLIVLSDANALRELGTPEDDIRMLQASVPRTVAVTPANAETLWADRRNQFFKPARGYGSKATYSGAKLTRRVWSEILAGGYVAQAFAPPGRRRIYRDGALVELKVDVRLYTYEGEVLLVAARLYQGQTTNMRTAGGGFAPVFEMGDQPGNPT